MTNDDKMRISVDLPEPLAPMRPNISPRVTSNETSCTARTRRRGRRRRRGPTPGVNVLDTRRTTSGTSEGKGDMAVLAARERTEHAPGGIKHADAGSFPVGWRTAVTRAPAQRAP